MNILAENNDTLLTGFSGLVILIVVIWIFVHYARRK